MYLGTGPSGRRLGRVAAVRDTAGRGADSASAGECAIFGRGGRRTIRRLRSPAKAQHLAPGIEFVPVCPGERILKCFARICMQAATFRAANGVFRPQLSNRLRELVQASRTPDRPSALILVHGRSSCALLLSLWDSPWKDLSRAGAPSLDFLPDWFARRGTKGSHPQLTLRRSWGGHHV
jgi:hypothetical protein